MALDFPTPTIVGQTYTSGSRSWIWDGTSWLSNTSTVTGMTGATGPGSAYKNLGIVIDGGGAVITTGSKAFINVPYACTVTQWTVLGDQSGNIVVDIKRSTYSGFPTTSSIIGAGNKPTLSTAQKNQAAPSSWSDTTLDSGDVLEFNVDSVTTVTRVSVLVTVSV